MKGAAKPVRSLADLAGLKQDMQEQARQRGLREAQEALARQRSASARDLFVRAAGVVQPLPDAGRTSLRALPPQPVPWQHLRDERAALQESLSDGFDVGTLLDVDDQLSFRRPGIGTDVTRKLRQGHWSIQRQLDLHGLRSDDARQALTQFVREACQSGIRCIRVVHGKGLGSVGKTPVLKNKVHSWLVQKNEVLAFVQAKPSDGGAGALVVLLKPLLRA